MRPIYMKGVIILFCLFYISSVSALPSLSIYGNEFQPGETLVGNITDVNQTLTASDLKFFDGRREVSFEKDLVNSEGNYYFYVVFNREGNFSMKVENVFYREDGALKSLSLEKNFEVKKKENFSQILYIKPGVIFTTQDFDLSLTNKGNEMINYSYGKKNKSSLNVGETEKINIIPSEKFSLFEIKAYKTFVVPIVYLKINIENNTNNSVEEKIISLRSSPKKVELQKQVGETIDYTFELLNFGIENLTDISIMTSLDFLKTNRISLILAKTAANLTIVGVANKAGLFGDNITVSYSENGTKEELKIPLTIYVFPVNASPEEIKQSLSCFDVGGKLCEASEVCVGPMSDQMGGCCKSCQKTKSENSNGVIVGILIIVFLSIVGFAVYKKFKNVKPKNKLISS